MENELAILAIKGGRHSEAEQIFNTEITTKPTSMAYYGLGICKINMTLNIGRTIDEVFYCFEKAISLSDEFKRSQVEIDIITVSIANLEQLQNLYQSLEAEKKKQASDAVLGAALTVGAMMIGSSHKSNAFTQISSLAVASAGVGLSLDGISKLGTIPEIQNEIVVISTKTKIALENIIQINKKELAKSLEKLNELHAVTIRNKLNNKWYNNKTKVIIALVWLLPLGLYALWKSDQFSQKTKIIITSVVIFIIVFINVSSKT